MKAIVLAAAVALATPAAAVTVLWDEAIDGDLAGDGSTFTLTWDTADVGEDFLIRGFFFGEDDVDGFLIEDTPTDYTHNSSFSFPGNDGRHGASPFAGPVPGGYISSRDTDGPFGSPDAYPAIYEIRYTLVSTASPVPLPAGGLLLLCGLGALAIKRRA